MGLYDVDWLSSMQQTFSFYKVDPKTWRDLPDPITTVKQCSITRNLEDETLSYATLDADGIEGEFYIRIYMDVIQNKTFHHIPLGTYLTQTNISSFDGKQANLSIDAFSPLIELKEKIPQIGYFIPSGKLLSDGIKQIFSENCRAPLSENAILLLNSKEYSLEEDFIANSDENWLEYIESLLKTLELSLGLTELGEIDIIEDSTIENKSPIWTYTDDQKSILYPQISINQDLYGIPNVVELVLSTTNETKARSFRSENRNVNSPLSIQNRGREVTERIFVSELLNVENADYYYQQMADSILDQRSAVDYTVEYTHGFCPVKVGDCVKIKYNRSGFGNIKAKVISQNIDCTPGCSVSESAIYTMNLWR